MKTGIEIIAAERKRHFTEEGFTPEHDATHKNGELANAGAFYAMTDDLMDFINDNWGQDMYLHIWPFELEWIKRSPKDRIRDLAKAGSFIAAEIDRIKLEELVNQPNRKDKDKA